ncbi:hypothetical protein H5071_12865 [Shewanella sp. SR41-2]|nr:hypothetical protein [Shewanella sp. SR41-2]
MSGLSGAVRQSTLQNLSNMTIVLDDLERLIDPKIIADILGTCLRFAEHNQVKIIVVANEDALSDKSKIEKTFSDIITLSRSSDELINILSDKYKSTLESTTQMLILRYLNKFKDLSLNIDNLRVIQRAINRIIKLKNRVDSIEGLDLPLTHEIITQQILGVSFLAYAKCYSEKDFKDFLSLGLTSYSTNFKTFNSQRNGEDVEKELCKDEQKIEEQNKIIRSIFSSISLNEGIVHFCFTNLIPFCDDAELINKLGLPIAASPLDQLIKGYFFNLSEKEFDQGLLELEELLFGGANKDYYQWVKGCETYLYLINKNYLNKVKTDELNRLKDLLTQGEIIDFSTIEHGQFNRWLNVPEELDTHEFKSLLGAFITKSEEHKNAEFAENFYTNWQQAIFTGPKDYDRNPFLHYLNVSNFCGRITQWKGGDIMAFIDFVKERFTISNAKDRYEVELPFIQQLIPKLKIKQSEVNGKLMNGIISELVQEFELALEQLT